MSFDVEADAYARFMGRFSEPLAAGFAELVGPRPGQRALDVGCGPGALTGQLVDRLGADAVSAVDPSASFVAAIRAAFPGEADLAGAREGHLAELFAAAGLDHIEPTTLTVRVSFATFADWWEPFTLGVGPAGTYVGGLDADGREALRTRCSRLMPAAPFEVAASAWCVRARAQGLGAAIG